MKSKKNNSLKPLPYKKPTLLRIISITFYVFMFSSQLLILYLSDMSFLIYISEQINNRMKSDISTELRENN